MEIAEYKGEQKWNVKYNFVKKILTLNENVHKKNSLKYFLAMM